MPQEVLDIEQRLRGSGPCWHPHDLVRSIKNIDEEGHQDYNFKNIYENQIRIQKFSQNILSSMLWVDAQR